VCFQLHFRNSNFQLLVNRELQQQQWAPIMSVRFKDARMMIVFQQLTSSAIAPRQHVLINSRVSSRLAIKANVRLAAGGRD